MRNLLFIVLLSVALAQSYNQKTSSELAHMSLIAYESVSTINAWNCSKCAQHPLAHVKAFSNSVGDLQGFTGYSSTLNGIVLCFRGSSNIQNWILDLSTNMVNYPGCGNCKVHNGFYAAWQLAKILVNPQIQGLRALYRDAPIYITGHSLGGAIAALSTPETKNLYGNVAALYTFGEPRVGNTEFSMYMEATIKSFRVTHYADLAVHVPPEAFGFHHESTEVWYDEAMKTYKICTVAESPNCSNSLPITSFTTNDHAMETYATLPASFLERAIAAVETFTEVARNPSLSPLYGYLTRE